MDYMIEKSKIRKFALVNVHHTEKSFDKLCFFLQTSARLENLDISWSSVRPPLMLKLLKIVQTNRSLVSLSLSYNALLEDQKTELTVE